MPGSGLPNGHGDKVSRKQEAAIAALLTCATIGQAAAQCQISESTLTRWLRDPGFQAAYREAKHQALAQTLGLLLRVASVAVGTLLTIVRDPDAPASARVSACRTVLELSIRGVELEDLESRIALLEQRGVAGLTAVNGAHGGLGSGR